MYEFRTKPYRHQVEALRLAYRKPAFGFFMEMGTGKSKVIIDEIAELYEDHGLELAVIFAPKGVYMNWVVNEFPTHLPDRVAIQADILAWESGGRDYRQRWQKLFAADDRLKILVVNTESMSSGDRAFTAVKELVSTCQITYGAVDESTFIKTPDSNRTERVVKLGQMFTYRRIATGSPVTRSPLDLYSQFEFLGSRLLGFGSYFAFRARYAVLVKKKFPGRKFTTTLVVGYREIDDLSHKIQPYSYRVLKEQCLDLPQKIYVMRAVEMTDEQRRIYDDIRKRATTALGEMTTCPVCEGRKVIVLEGEDYPCTECMGDGVVRDGDHVTVSQVITQILRMHQVLCGHVPDESGVLHDIPSHRLSVLSSVLEESTGKAIIWSRYRHDIDKIVALLRKTYGDESVVEFHGGTSQVDRAIASDRFQNDDKCRYMVSNAQTGGFGNTWTAASLVIYYSNDYNLEKRLQSEDRAHRAGQTKSVTYVDLYCPGTVEEKIIKSLRDKIDIAAAITGDGPRAWLI